MFPRFEVRVGEADEDLAQLSFSEEVRKESHCVGAKAGCILVEATGVLGAQGTYPIGNVGGNLSSDFKT